MTHEINIYGDIVPFKWYNDGSEFDLASLNDALKDITFEDNDNLNVNIHTFGGCTTTAFGIYNKLLNLKKRHNITITTHIDGYCASSGVIILLAGDNKIGNAYAEPFIHNAWTWTMGDKNEHQKQMEDLQRVDNQIATLYAERTKIDKEKALELMDADGHITAQQALEYGFYTEIENVYTDSQSLVFNSISALNREKRKINKDNNMNKTNDVKFTKEDEGTLSKLKNLLGFGKTETTKNIIVKTADQKDLDFYEREEGEPQVGDKAKLEDKDAQGEIVIADGRTFIFEEGVLTEIKEDEGDDKDKEIEDLKKQLEEANAKLEEKDSEIENKKSEITTLKNNFSELETKHNALTNKLQSAFSNIQIEDPNPNPKGKKGKKLTMAERIAQRNKKED